MIKSFMKFYCFLIILFDAFKMSLETGGCPIYSSNFEKQMTPTTADMLHKLIANCNYDKMHPPPMVNREPLKVFVKVYFYFLKSFEAHNLQFTVYMLLQSRFVDTRLQFDPKIYNVTQIVGTREVCQLLWLPHIYVSNERQSEVMGPNQNEVMIHIHHDGTVLHTKRVKTTLFCWMKLHKFPFDYQDCTLELDSWSYNMAHMILQWENTHPVLCRDHLTLTEFTLVGQPDISETIDNLNFDQDASGDFQGNYSSLVVTFHLRRESGFYVYDYFIPSIFLVVVSWVSFWLEVEEAWVSSRVVLGCSTMLAFIILAHHTGTSLPRVSYIKASEIWFLGCTAFIFGSLAEFAFVNSIYRSHRKRIELKKLSSGFVLKETLTWNHKRKIIKHRSLSVPNSLNAFGKSRREKNSKVAFRTGSLPDIRNLETRSKIKDDKSLPTVLTPKEVSNWIDKRSRVWFPISFLVFNIGYWCYVYCM